MSRTYYRWHGDYSFAVDDDTYSHAPGKLAGIIDDIETQQLDCYLEGKDWVLSESMRKAAEHEFARLHSMSVSRSFDITRLSPIAKDRYEHVSYYRKHGNPVAVVVQAGDSHTQMIKAAEEDGLKIKLLRRSWVDPADYNIAILSKPLSGNGHPRFLPTPVFPDLTLANKKELK